MGAECKFIYNNFDTNSMQNPDYISKYINNFTKYINFMRMILIFVLKME